MKKLKKHILHNIHKKYFWDSNFHHFFSHVSNDAFFQSYIVKCQNISLAIILGTLENDWQKVQTRLLFTKVTVNCTCTPYIYKATRTNWRCLEWKGIERLGCDTVAKRKRNVHIYFYLFHHNFSIYKGFDVIRVGQGFGIFYHNALMYFDRILHIQPMFIFLHVASYYTYIHI